MLFGEAVQEARVTLPPKGAVRAMARVEPSYCQVLSLVDPTVDHSVSFHLKVASALRVRTTLQLLLTAPRDFPSMFQSLNSSEHIADIQARSDLLLLSQPLLLDPYIQTTQPHISA